MRDNVRSKNSNAKVVSEKIVLLLFADVLLKPSMLKKIVELIGPERIESVFEIKKSRPKK